MELTQYEARRLEALKKIILSFKLTKGKSFFKMELDSLIVSPLIGDDYKSYVAFLGGRKEDIVPKLNCIYCVAKTKEQAIKTFGKILESVDNE